MRKRMAWGLCLFLSASLMAGAWESGTHAYLMNRINAATGTQAINQTYGIMAPDFVNFLLGSPYRAYLYDQTHENFMKLWRQARTGPTFVNELALAFGFVCHNNVWGTDSTAHVASLTLNPNEGWIITKAKLLDQALMSTWEALGIAGDEFAATRLEITHEIIEILVDIKVWQLDPTIGAAMVQSATDRADAISFMLKRAYAGNLVAYSQQTPDRLNEPGALAVLTMSEGAFRNNMTLYGGIFTLADQDAIELALAGYLVNFASYFGLSGAIDANGVKQIFDLTLASGLVDDFKTELDATVTFVQGQLAAHGVTPTGKAGVEIESLNQVRLERAALPGKGR